MPTSNPHRLHVRFPGQLLRNGKSAFGQSGQGYFCTRQKAVIAFRLCTPAKLARPAQVAHRPAHAGVLHCHETRKRNLKLLPFLTYLAGLKRRVPARRAGCPVSLGWLIPSVTGTSEKSNGLTPSRQATFTPYVLGSDLRWRCVCIPQCEQKKCCADPVWKR